MPEVSTLLAALWCGGLALLLVLLVAELRGRVPDPLRRPSPLQRLAGSFAHGVSGRRLLLACTAGTGVLLATRWPVAAAASTLLVAAWPQLVGGAAAERTQITRLEQLTIWTESLRDTAAAHLGLEAALASSVATAPPLIRPALVRFAGRVQARVPLEQALLGLAAELDDPASADPIIAALVLHARRRGDRLTEVLTGLARTARAELDLRRRVVAGRAELRRGVVIIIAISLGMVAYLAVFNRAFIAPYASPAGQLALAVVLGMFGAGFLVLRRAVASPKRAAFLPRPGLEPDLAGLRLVAGLTTTASASSSEVGRSR